MRKRIAVFSLAQYPVVGGAEVAMKEIIERLPDLEFKLFSHDFKKYGHGKLAKFFYVFRAWRAAEKAHREEPFGAIWAMMAAYGGLAALFFKFRHPKTPMLLTLQEGDSEAHILSRVGIFYPIWKLIFKKSDRIQVISNYLADFARRHGATCPIEVAPNGVDIKAFSVERLASSKSSKTLNAKPYTLITTSRLVYKNGVDTLVDAVKLLKESVRLEILGDGPQSHALELRAKNPPKNVEIIFRGHVDPAQIPEYLAKADVFVRPSRSEGLGSSFLEAMAAGLPIIGAKVGGIPDFLQGYNTNARMNTNDTNNTANGSFVEVDNPEDLANKISLLIKNEKLRKRLGENGRRLVLENYSWERISEKMHSIFNALITNYQLPIARLLVATGIYPPDIGGPATYTVLLEQELPKRGFKVDHLAFTEFRKKPKVIRHIVYFWKCFWLAGKFDIIYAQDPVSVGLPSLIAARLRRKKFFIRVAGDYAWEQAAQRFGIKDTIDNFQRKKYGLRTELLRKIQRFVAGRADLVITPSKYFQRLVGGWIKNPEAVRVIYNGINLRSSKDRRSFDDLKSGRKKTILSAGRLVPWKGFDVLIEVMKDLPDWKLIIIGDGPERARLESLIASHGLSDRVQLTGSVPRDKLLDYLDNASIFTLNTSFESFSFQVVEAMNAGLPVVTTNIGNLAEIIENGKEGILVEPNNKDQILSAIRKIDSDEKFRQKIITNAKEKAKQFSIEKTMDNLAIHLTNGTSR